MTFLRKPDDSEMEPVSEAEFLADMASLCKKTPVEWLGTPEFKGIQILDPDGWDLANYDEDWAKPLTRQEFFDKLVVSTCIFPKGMIEPLNTDELPPERGRFV